MAQIALIKAFPQIGSQPFRHFLQNAFAVGSAIFSTLFFLDDFPANLPIGFDGSKIDGYGSAFASFEKDVPDAVV